MVRVIGTLILLFRRPGEKLQGLVSTIPKFSFALLTRYCLIYFSRQSTFTTFHSCDTLLSRTYYTYGAVTFVVG